MIRRIVPLMMALLISSFSFPVFAAEGEEDPEPSQEVVTVETETENQNIVVNVTLPAAVTPSPAPELPEINLVNDTPTYASYSDSELNSAADPNVALVDAVRDLFGDYTPRTQTITDHLADGSTVTYQEVVPGLAGLDWPWLVSVGLFALFLYGLLRIIGGLIKL